MGAMGVARHDGIVSPAYNVYRPTQAFDPDYLDYLVRTPMFVTEITRYSKGVWSSRMRLYPEGLYEASMPVPPLEEQAQIVREIAHQIQHIDALSHATKDTVELLEERRTALIAAAISGQLELKEQAT
jgi:type I restriction enzyme S subunit